MAARAKKLVVGNWKMYIQTPEEALALAGALRRKARAFSGVEIIVAPPAPFVQAVAHHLQSSPILVAGQACSPFSDERHTGEVSAQMLKSAGAAFLLVGHSERRSLGRSDGEDGETVALETQNTIQAGMRPIVCVGELQRDTSGSHFGIIATQLHESLRHIKTFGSKVVVAYEPVWAIGKTAAEAMSAQDLQETVIFIRKTLADIFPRSTALKVPILYGGSVEKENAEVLLRDGGISGFLVGHASVDAQSIIDIVEICNKK